MKPIRSFSALVARGTAPRTTVAIRLGYAKDGSAGVARGTAPLAIVAWLLAGARPALAAPPAPVIDPYVDWHEEHGREADPKPDPLQLINYFFTRASVTNQLADPSGLKGVSLGPFGTGVGSATRTGDKSTTFYVEQRWIPVLSYSPPFVDGLATFRAQMEVDFTWGLSANQVQQNQGGGLNADQINIQTKNVNVSLYPTRDPDQLSIVIGTQAAYDTVFDPATTPLFDLVKTGYKLAFLGTDATGISLYSRAFGYSKLSFFPLGAAQPDKATDDDARFSYVYLITADYAYPIAPGTMIGVSAWHLQDDTQGAAYAYEGLVKSGPSSSGLSTFTGTSRFNIDEPEGHVEYVGANFSHDPNFFTGDISASGFFMSNFGRFKNTKKDSALLDEVKVRGFAADLELAYRWGTTNRDLITLEGLFTSGDDDPNDEEYTSAFTMNFYGLPGAVWFTHKTLILFPFTSTVNNYTGAVTDISNQGYGLTTAIVTASHDLIPNKLNLKIGAATAQSSVTPPRAADGAYRGRFIGIEANAELRYDIRYLMTVGLHAAYMWKGSFYNDNPQVADDPWAAFTTFTWYAF